MLRQVVSSQIIRSIGYDAETGILEVQFQNGWLYRYQDVPPRVHRELMAADSHGRYLKRQIVDRFATTRIA